MHYRKYCLVTAITTAIAGCGGNGLGSGTDAEANTDLTIGISDAPVESANEVVIEIESIRLQRAGEDVIFETFTGDQETITVDLLDYQGSAQLTLINSEEVPTGDYTDFILEINDNGIEESYLLDDEGVQHSINVPSGNLRLGSFSLTDGDNESLIIEFNLRKALAERPGSSPDGFNLKPRGVRLVNDRDLSTLSGTVDSDLFDTDDSCSDKTDPTVGNVVYLYQGHNLDVASLGDVFDPDEEPDATLQNPFEAVTVTQNDQTLDWEYEFGFLEAGNYTLAFSCNAEGDNPELLDELEIPLPVEQVIQITLEENQNAACDLPITDDECFSEDP